jgi:hypothetical protein
MKTQAELVTEAREFWDRVQGLDGAGCVLTDDVELAQEVAAMFGVDPFEVWDGYEMAVSEDDGA